VGNTDSATITYTLDTVAPVAVAVTSSDASSGYLNAADTNPVTLSVAGADTAEITTVKVYDAFGNSATATEDSGAYKFDPAGLSDGALRVEVTQTDAAGNVTTVENALTLTLDTSTEVTIATSAGTVASTSQTITGVAEAGSKVDVSGDIAADVTAQAGADGTWSASVTLANANAANTLTATVTDAAGNTSTDQVVLTGDGTAPTFSPSTTPSISEGSTKAGALVYTPTSATDASTVTYSLKEVDDFSAFDIDTSTGKVYAATTLDYEVQTSYDFTVVATDAAGNATEADVTLTLTDVDEVTPVLRSASVDGTSLTLTYSEALDDSIGEVPRSLTTTVPAPAIVLPVNCAAVPVSVWPVSISALSTSTVAVMLLTFRDRKSVV
jgi:hypothetical protein